MTTIDTANKYQCPVVDSLLKEIQKRPKGKTKIRLHLADWKQQVIVKGSKYSWSVVLSSIPQGSVLGPLLYIIYVKDLPLHVDNHICLFADDSKLYTGIANLNDHYYLQSELDNLKTWSDRRQTSFNTSKCKSINFSASNPCFVCKLDKKPIQQVNKEKDLGIAFDNQLKFHAHAALPARKANTILGLINQCFNTLDSYY